MTLAIRQPSARNSFVLLLSANLALGVFGFATSTLSARLLGTSGRGELAAIQNVPNLLAILAGLGLGEAALYFTSRQPNAARWFVRRGVRLTLFGALPAMVVGAVVLPFVIDGHRTVVAAELSLPVVLIVPMFMVAHQPLRGIGRIALWTGFRISIAVAWLSILLVATVADVRSAMGVALAYVGAQALIALVALAITKHYPAGEQPHDGPELSRRMLRYGIPSSLVALPQVLNLRLDQVLLASLVVRSQLGLYVAAVSWSWIAAPPFQALAQLALPRLAAATDPTHRRRMTRLVVLIALGGALASVAVLIPVTQFAFPLVMGSDFRAGTGVARLLVVAGTISGVVVVVEEVIRGLGRPIFVLASEGIGLAITIGLLFAVLPRYGIRGAAVVSIAAYSLVLTCLLVLLPRALRSSSIVGRPEQRAAAEPEGGDGEQQPVGEQRDGEPDVHQRDDDQHQ